MRSEAEGAVAAPVVRSIESLEVDAEYEGLVKSVTDFGVFVDLGMPTDGLVHKSQLSNTFVANIADLGLEKGQTVKVRVLSVDVFKGQVSLSMKAKGEASVKPPGERKGKDLSKYEAMSPQDEIEATVDSVMPYGAFVKFEDGTQGLVHISQLSVDRVESTGDAVSTGDKVKVRVLAVENGKLQLSMKPYSEREEKPQKRGNDLSKYEAMSPQDEIEATVDSVMPYGAFVKFEDGAQGLVHISQLSVGRVESTGDAVSPGDKVKVRVLAVDNGKLQLSMKPYDENEKPPPKRDRQQKDDDGLSRRDRPQRIDDIWSDNTEPKWKELQVELTEKYTKTQFDNVLEFKLSK